MTKFLKIRIWLYKQRIKFMAESIRIDKLCLENWMSILQDMKVELEKKRK